MTVQDVRAFNRFYTNVIGALDYSRHLYAPFTLTESRVLYELAHAPRTDAADLRAQLSLDAGYLSRILNKFEEDGLVERSPSETDPRRRRVTLTGRGRETAALLAERADRSVGALLGGVGAADRTRLAEALRTVREILSDGRPPRPEDVVLREPRPGDLGWIVQRNAALYAAEYGFNADYEGLVARIVADFGEDHDPHLERVWIAELDGRPVGCVMCVRDEAPGSARLRLLLVEPEARGLGVGDRLVGAVVGFARGAGYRDVVLWTNDILTAARRLYLRHGFALAAEKPHRSFGKDLNGQDWRLDLHRARE
ncbi:MULTISPECIES: bifunctional helix-turn-helix transcriptional regulator/GNAT family N-acetyltransferase [Streptomyces]|uniref:Bifunctional helix-turn-helix transcriptional regulator/GNAT family N-acetyltransferase n=1 Tax=Streptomyces doudnae TaxID=3075536 RepID=A0ABD5EQK5_9ACTN|nr:MULTISPECIES: bifunctional helix-turn-helix transcriptional regulator/GNAT family N-acetyltransferase [unclassified Streptomyces]MDT0435984.1 bifunctional helix-turn-helix transcriptional regulator/GNAT family N-acetyltransferase [Streptomyces sp. DSM 41981]MYQ64567.1 GNAT family N-acetyltransferase [Streptomyces sp. SID4950]SCD81618.1 transcriptional regulator, MarR family with acetyltransferase activity [Streptomyces sp. SolWspMP-5a-2]